MPLGNEKKLRRETGRLASLFFITRLSAFFAPQGWCLEEKEASSGVTV